MRYYMRAPDKRGRWVCGKIRMPGRSGDCDLACGQCHVQDLRVGYADDCSRPRQACMVGRCRQSAPSGRVGVGRLRGPDASPLPVARVGSFDWPSETWNKTKFPKKTMTRPTPK